MNVTTPEYWQSLDYSKSYSEWLARSIRVFLQHAGLTEQDIAGIMKLAEFRNRVKPEMPLDQFVLMLTYLAELNFLSDEAYEGYKKFYGDDEIIRDRLEAIGRVLYQKEKIEDDEDPIEWMITEFLARYYQEKVKNTITVGVDTKLLSEFMTLATDDEGKKFGQEINHKVNALLKDWVKRIKDRAFREKLRKK